MYLTNLKIDLIFINPDINAHANPEPEAITKFNIQFPLINLERKLNAIIPIKNSTNDISSFVFTLNLKIFTAK